jgi:rhodanese-related sulfurtransferase
MKLLIVGGVAGGASAAARSRRLSEDELPRGRKIAAYCQVGKRGYLATRILLQVGYSAVNVGGGYETYKLFHHSIRLSTSGIP